MNKEALENFKDLSQVWGRAKFAENLHPSSFNKGLSNATPQPDLSWKVPLKLLHIMVIVFCINFCSIIKAI
jgi:hypothetical protein